MHLYLRCLLAVFGVAGTAVPALAQGGENLSPAEGPGYYLPKQILQLATTTTTETRRASRAYTIAGAPCDSGAPAYSIVPPAPTPRPAPVPGKPGTPTPSADPPAPQVPEQLGKLCIEDTTTTTRVVDAQLKLVPDLQTGIKKLTIPGKALADVKLSVQYRDGGLLKNINASSQGRGGDLIIGIAKIAGTVLGGGAAMFAQGGAPPPPTACNPFFAPFKDQPDNLRLLLSRNESACNTWKSLSTWSTHAEKLAADVKAAEEKLGGVNGGTELADLVARLKDLRKGADDAKKMVVTLQASVTAMLDNFLRAMGLGTKVEQTHSLDVLELHELPGEKVEILDGVTDWNSLQAKLRADAKLTAAADVLKRAGVVVRLVVPAGATAPSSSVGIQRCPEGANDRLEVWYRTAQTVRLQVFVAQTPIEDGRPKLDPLNKPQQVMRQMAESFPSVTHQGLMPRCQAFKAGSFANRELVVSFDDSGQLARIDYTAGSSAAAAVTALASAGSTFRDEYATTVAKMVEIDTNARKLKLSDLTTKVDTLKKEQERLDTQLAVDTAGANFDLVLKQRQLAAEAATLQAQTALDTAVATAEQRKAIEEMKLEIELVKRELELLKAKQELAAGKSGG